MDKRFHFQKRPHGVIGSVLLGMAFGAGWTPCIGPILASILFLAGTSSRIFQGTALLAVYSFGLGIPFILAGLFFSTFQMQMEKIRPHLHTIKIASGVLLIILGVLIFIGSFAKMNVFLFTLAGQLEAWNEGDPLGPRLLFGSIFLIFSFVLLFFYFRRVFRRISSSDLSIQLFFLPGRLIFILFFAATAILSFTGILNIPKIITLWLTFQGI
jgi:cytochrome c-type biogenesis protein